MQKIIEFGKQQYKANILLYKVQLQLTLKYLTL